MNTLKSIAAKGALAALLVSVSGILLADELNLSQESLKSARASMIFTI